MYCEIHTAATLTFTYVIPLISKQRFPTLSDRTNPTSREMYIYLSTAYSSLQHRE